MYGGGVHHYSHFLIWTSNGAELVFDFGKTIYIVDTEESEVRALADTNPSGYQAILGFYADVSPNSMHIVYSSCEFKTERDVYYSENAKYDYEIALLDLHTGRQQRLTQNPRLEHYPVWSPDGSRIAYIAPPQSLTAYKKMLYTMSADGSEGKLVVPTARVLAGLETGPIGAVAMYPPVWSPSGSHLAFLFDEEPSVSPGMTLYTVRKDGTEMTRIAEDAVSTASWSPDGQRLAVAKYAGEARETVALFTLAADGSDERLLTTITERETLDRNSARYRFGIHTVSWSPDGTQILYSCDDGACVVDIESGVVTGLVEGAPEWRDEPYIAAWSPDGARVAIYTPGESYPQLYTMALDGTDRRDLIRLDDDGNLVPAHPPEDE